MFVYTNSNTGSQCVVESIRNSGIEVIYFHYMISLRNKHPEIADNFSNKKPLKIVSLARNPIDWSMSFLFRRIRENNESRDLTVARNHLYTKYDYRNILHWFQSELATWTGVDFFIKPFDKDLGYQTYNMENIDLLVVRLEDLSADILSDFLDVKVKLLPIRNKTTDKNYVKFKNYPLPSEFIDEFKHSFYTKYFGYTI